MAGLTKVELICEMNLIFVALIFLIKFDFLTIYISQGYADITHKIYWLI